MKVLFFVCVPLIFIFACTEAENLQYRKDREATKTGLTRHITVYSAYTGTIVFDRVIKNSYFSAGESGGFDILDLKSQLKTSIRGENFIMVIDELPQ